MPDAAGPEIVIAGTREDWPGGAQTLTPRDPTREPNGRILWFGAELDPAGSQVWFRITAETVGRMREKTPRPPGAARMVARERRGPAVAAVGGAMASGPDRRRARRRWSG